MDIIKGESYTVPFVIKNDGVPVTNNDVDGVRIRLGNQIAYYPDGTLEFNPEDSTWDFPMTQKNTYSIIGKTIDYQVQVKINGDIHSSKETKIKIEETMFKTEW